MLISELTGGVSPAALAADVLVCEQACVRMFSAVSVLLKAGTRTSRAGTRPLKLADREAELSKAQVISQPTIFTCKVLFGPVCLTQDAVGELQI